MKGVSPVVATVLMVAVAIAAAVIAYSWSMSIISSAGSTASAKQGEIGRYDVQLEGVKCSADTSSLDLNLYIRNSSAVDINGSWLVQVMDTAGNEIAKEYKVFEVNAASTGTYPVSLSASRDMSNQKIVVTIRGPNKIVLSTDEPVTCT